MNFKSATIGLSACLLLSACATNNEQYYWGQYESIIYNMHNKPGEATPDVQVNLLLTDIQQAEAAGKPIAPGIYAHLGMMYAAQGKIQLAIEALEEEKALYPDSTLFIDGMIARATQNQVKG